MKLNHSPTDSVFVIRRFRQLVMAVVSLSVLSIVNILIGGGDAMLKNIAALTSVIAFAGFTFYLVTIDKEELARNLFLWGLAVGITSLSFINGGLHDSSVISYPIIIVYSALLGGFRVFLSILFYMIISIIFLGVQSINGWLPSSAPLGTEQVFDAILITLFAAYVAWTINTDMNTTLHSLSQENDKVNKSRETIQLMVEQDALTGLYNRPASELHFKQMLEALDTEQERIITFFIDLDNFKNINDSFGHNAGDELLIGISAKLNALIEPTDVAARFGGDEFVLIIKRDDSFNIDHFANELLKIITKPYLIFNSTINMTGSVGIAIAPDDGTDFSEVRKRADIAMYNSKQLGKNTFSYYSDYLHEETVRKSSMLNGLKDALDKNLLDLHFQPKVNLASGKVDSAEALVRWNRENPYDFGPRDFIPMIESTEMIHEIGKWCIQEACKICKKWHDNGLEDISIAVNVSSVQFMRSNFKNLVFNALQESGLEPHHLELELTEHVLVQHNETVKSQLKSLKDLGVKLSIDDFGTGYSNLSYLINFNVDTIKLDQSFITELNTSSEHLAIVTAIIQMAKILDMKVVAEGVESEAIKQILVDLKCDYGQGFLWSQPVPEPDFINNLTQFNGLVAARTYALTANC